MLSFSLRAVLRKESWIFCAGLFSICRSPCKLDVQNQLFLAARGAGGRKVQGGQPFAARFWRARNRAPRSSTPYNTRSCATFQPDFQKEFRQVCASNFVKSGAGRAFGRQTRLEAKSQVFDP